MRIRLIELFSTKVEVDFLWKLKKNLELLAFRAGPYAVTSGYTFTNADMIESLQVDATSGAITIYLPDQPNGDRLRRVIKTDASGNAVTLNGNGNLINGAATYALAAQYNSVTVEPTGTGWLIVASYP